MRDIIYTMYTRHNRRFFIYVILTLLVFITVERLAHRVLLDRNRANQAARTLVQTGVIRARLESVLTADLLIVNSVAAYVSVYPDLSKESFTRFAAEVFEDSTALHNLLAAPDLVIRYVYPLEGNEVVVGVDYRTLPDQLPLVREAIERDTLVIAGPTEILQGGIGLLGRAPVFTGRGENREPWGVVSAVIRLEGLMAVVEPLIEQYGLAVALRGVNGTGEAGPVFYGDPAVFTNEIVVAQDVMLPNGVWQIAAAPSDGWIERYPDQFPIRMILFLVMVVVIFGIHTRVTSDYALQASEQRFRDIVESSSDWIWEVDRNGVYTYTAGRVQTIMGYAPVDLLGKPYLDFIAADYRETVAEDMRALSAEREAVSDYELWLIARDGRRVCFLANAVPLFGTDGSFRGYRGVNKDITTRKTLQQQLERFVAIVDQYVIVSQCDLDGVITYASSAFARISGYDREELEGRRHNVVRHPEMPDELFADLWSTIKAGNTWHGEIKNRTKEGANYWVETDISPLRDHLGTPYGYIGIRQDITARKELEVVSVTDRLTGLYNRQKLDVVLADEWERYKRYGETFSLVILDIDHFKALNDTLGHLAGDRVLKIISSLIKRHSRVADVPGRWGGEEFLIICPHTSLEGAKSLAESLRRTISKEDFGIDRKVTASFGVATPAHDPPGNIGTDQLLIAADTALYRAKDAGRNRVVAYTDDRDQIIEKLS